MQGGIGFTGSETGWQETSLRFDMEHLLQARASMNRGKATGFGAGCTGDDQGALLEGRRESSGIPSKEGTWDWTLNL